MLPLFYTVLLLAAGSNASPCKPSSVSSAPAAGASSSISPDPAVAASSSASSAPAAAESSGTAAPPVGSTPGGAITEGSATPGDVIPGGAATPGGRATPGVGATPGGDATPSKKAAEQVAGSSNNLAGLSKSTNSTGGIAPATGGGSCPEGFINAVFNTNAPQSAGWPVTTWESMSGNGVNEWIGFSLGPLNTKSTYGNPPVTPALNAAQIHLMMDSDDTNAAVKLLQSPNAPKYLGLFNEPDFSFGGWTKTMDPEPAAQNLATLFSTPHPQTTLISPALMDANSDWLPRFKAACNGCFDQIPIIAAHVYNPTVEGALAGIKLLHGKWPDKKIWITELSPATADCSMDAAGIAVYMHTLLPALAGLGYVDKIFWNSGEWNMPAINGAPAACNPALTDAQGKPTQILTSLKNACGGSGSTATS